MEVEMKIRGLMMDPATNMPIVILKDVNLWKPLTLQMVRSTIIQVNKIVGE